jgi:hypothetical protein
MNGASEYLRITEVNGVEPNENNGGPSSTLVRFGAIVGRSGPFPILSVSSSDTSDDKVGNSHADAANDENRLSTESIDVQNGGYCRQEHHNAYYTRGQ